MIEKDEAVSKFIVLTQPLFFYFLSPIYFLISCSILFLVSFELSN